MSQATHPGVRAGRSLSLRLFCRVWSLDDSPALDILENQQVVIDCGGKYFNYHSSRGELTMGQGSTLHYHNCSLVNYDFPETNRVYGTLHKISSSTIGMQTCTVRQ